MYDNDTINPKSNHNHTKIEIFLYRTFIYFLYITLHQWYAHALADTRPGFGPLLSAAKSQWFKAAFNRSRSAFSSVLPHSKQLWGSPPAWKHNRTPWKLYINLDLEMQACHLRQSHWTRGTLEKQHSHSSRTPGESILFKTDSQGSGRTRLETFCPWGSLGRCWAGGCLSVEQWKNWLFNKQSTCNFQNLEIKKRKPCSPYTNRSLLFRE